MGNGDLVSLFPNSQWETYDIIADYPDVIHQDTLLNPPDYKGKWVITNPPFLAKNKANDKGIFNKYHLDDMYKIALYTALKAEGGIFIIPTNFFTDEASENIRREFLSVFQIIHLNIFTTPVFDSTTYSVCAFAFQRRENIEQVIPVSILPQNINITIKIYQQYGYRIGGEIYSQLQQQKIYFTRLTNTTPSTAFITKIKLYALDTRTEKIHTTYGEEPYIGKSTDRVYLTFVCNHQLSDEIQQELSTRFNQYITNFRNTYADLGMTNYRDYNRKRIGFTFAYQILSHELEQIELNF